MLSLFALVPVLIWLYLLLARGAFWRAPVLARDAAPSGNGAAPLETELETSARRSVVAVIPARNEAALIGAVVSSLLQQRFAGMLHVVVVDDASSDATAAAATAAAETLGQRSRLTVIHGAPLPTGWTGKLWAMAQGLEAALHRAPDYLLFTDADIRHEPGHLEGLVAAAERGNVDMVSGMVTLSMQSAAERWLMPAFVFFFFLLYPPAWVASRRAHSAAAAGGCMLVRSGALGRIGGLTVIRDQIIDDCALARAIKRSGGSLCLALTRGACTLRRYESIGEIGRLISRTAFNQLRHSYGLLILTIAGLAVTYLAPPLLVLSGRPLAGSLGLAAWALMCLAYLPMLRFYRRHALWSASLPAIAAFYAGATLHSAWQYGRGRGGAWKGRNQDLRADAR